MSELFVVQSYTRGAKGGLRQDIPIQANSTAHARSVAERLAPTKALVVAFMRKGDTLTGEFEDAQLITALGDVPDEILEMPRVH